MDDEIIYSVVAIIGFIIIIIFTLRSATTTQIQTKEQTKQGIVDGYKKQLHNALVPLKNDKQARISKKNELLKKFNSELALNIYFEKSDIKEVILELLRED